jgi:hypothetical protein
MRLINECLIYFSWLEVSLTLDVSSAGFEALSKLPLLQQFIFAECMEECDWKHEVRFFNLCTEYLPQLRVAGQRFDVMDMDDLLLDGYPRARGYHNELVQQLKRPASLSLELLDLADDVLPAKRIKFSQIKELVLWNPSSRVLDWCDSHASLTALGLYEYNETDITPVLLKVGQRLQSLALCVVSTTISLAEVLQLCPRLKRFKVSSCKVKKDPDQWPEAAFSFLEDACFEKVNLPPGFLIQVIE